MYPSPDLSDLDTAPLPCVIDIEASGFGRGSYPIEIGFVRGDGRAFCTLVRPPAHWTHWDGEAERLHGLTRELLQKHGRPVDEVAARLNQELAGETVYTDGWAHDFTWLATLFEAAGRAPAFRLKHLHEGLDSASQALWDAACREVRTEMQLQRHRASADARVLQRAWCRVQDLDAPPWQATEY